MLSWLQEITIYQKNHIAKVLQQAPILKNIDQYTKILYEGFIPGGIAIIIETLTNNSNKTVAEIRNILNKYGGTLEESGNVRFLFKHVGKIKYNQQITTHNEIIENVLISGAIDIEVFNNEYIIYSSVDSFSSCLKHFKKLYGTPVEAKIIWIPHNLLIIKDQNKISTLLKLIDNLKNNNSVQQIFVNYTIHKTKLRCS
jgi:transcriptional/translational regulatory protein YebC/TACO1